MGTQTGFTRGVTKKVTQEAKFAFGGPWVPCRVREASRQVFLGAAHLVVVRVSSETKQDAHEGVRSSHTSTTSYQ